MSDEASLPFPKADSPVTTACNGYILYEEGTPSAIYKGKRVYFCLPSCLKAFEDDPRTSCMASDFLNESG